VDDPFAVMEQHAIEMDGITLARTLDGFGPLVRQHDAIGPTEWVFPVRGPSWG
jgi:hypothetical protein